MAGLYRTEIIVEEKILDPAWEAACEYDEAIARLSETTGFFARKRAERRINTLQKYLCDVTRQEFRGDIVRADWDVASGLVEPYSPYDKADRVILSGMIAERLISGDVEVSGNSILW